MPVASISGGQDWRTNTLLRGLTIQVPPSVTISRRSPNEDFRLIFLKKSTNIVLTIYLGNQPDFPARAAANSLRVENINGLKAETLLRSEPDGTTSRDVLLHLREDGVWPQRMHCWHTGLAREAAAETDRIISSVRLRAPPTTSVHPLPIPRSARSSPSAQ